MAVTTAAVGIGATIAGGAIKAMGDLFSGQAQSNMYKYQAGVALARAQNDELKARWAEEAGEENALREGLRGRFSWGNIHAGQGASNVDVNTGTSVNVRAGQTEVTQMTEAQTRTNFARKAYGFRVDEAGDIATAGAANVAAKNAITGSYYDAAASILGTASSVASEATQASKSLGSNTPAATDPTYSDYGYGHT
jgi:hypothetical protein